MLAVVVLYWSKFWKLEVLKRLVVAFLPTGVIGLSVYKILKTYLLGNMTVVLSSLFVGGIALLAFERWKVHAETEADFSEITYKQALLIGLFQSVAIIPGVSRSAATIVGGPRRAMRKRAITERCFRLPIPP